VTVGTIFVGLSGTERSRWAGEEGRRQVITPCGDAVAYGKKEGVLESVVSGTTANSEVQLEGERTLFNALERKARVLAPERTRTLKRAITGSGE